MTQLKSNQPVPSLEVLSRFNLSLLKSISLLRWVGYGFLVLALFDLIEILFPPNLMNPAWEFQVMGQMVERVAVPLLGLGLVFMGERSSRDRWEVPFVKLFSWLTLLFALIYLLLIPLGAINTLRLDRQSDQQITTQVDRATTQIQELKTQLETVSNPDELESLIGRLNNGNTPEIVSFDQFQVVKQQLETVANNGEEQIASRSEEVRSNQRQNLFKRSIKWNLGALISAILFFSLFRGTAWARQRW